MAWLLIQMAILSSAMAQFPYDPDPKCLINCQCCEDSFCDEITNCIIGCIDGYFGNKCLTKCPTRCEICERHFNVNSTCTACKSGNYNSDTVHDCSLTTLPCPLQCTHCNSATECTACIDGYYITASAKDCSTPCQSPCTSCSSAKYCTACEAKFYLGNTGTCNPCRTGCAVCTGYNQCTSCEPNFTGSLCDSCVTGMGGLNCDIYCRPNCLTCSSVDFCLSCDPRFHGEYCLQNCSSNCLGGICNQNDGHCSNGCVSGFSGEMCCVNTLNCETCSSNDVCSSCVQGWHSSRCEMKCPENCSDEGCNKRFGVCYGCKGHRYGDQCEKYCPVHCVHPEVTSRCNYKTGNCIDACVDGLYGNKCDESCSSNCNNKTCNKESAACVWGCTGGYTGTTCSEGEKSANNVLPIIGTVVGGTLGMAVVILLVLNFMKYRRMEQMHKHSRSHGEQDEPTNVYADLNLTEVSSNNRDYDSLEPPHVSQIPGSNADMDTPSSHVYQNDVV